MHPPRRSRWLAWSALALIALAVPMFFVPGGGESWGHRGWAIAGAIVLHPAAFAGLGAFFTYRELDEEGQREASVARWALFVVIGAIALLWLFWT